MTNQEIRIRLKHCAGLLYSLSMDLNVDDERIAELEHRNEELENEIVAMKSSGEYKRAKARQRYATPEVREKHLEAMKRYNAKKNADKPPKPKLTDEERKERQRESARRYQAKKKAEKKQSIGQTSDPEKKSE